MLAASTVGPGTVIVCSKAGMDFGVELCWALVLASLVAYAMQADAARLSIESGATLGAAMRRALRVDGLAGATPRACVAVACGLCVGNAAYQANNFAGAAEAAYALGAPRTSLAARLALHAVTATTTISTLFFGDVDAVSSALGVVAIAMIFVFAAAVHELGNLDGGALALGMLPVAMPAGSAVVAVSMVATTAIPFNAFLASCAAKRPTRAEDVPAALAAMQRGVAFSTAIAGLLSVLVVATGAGLATARRERGEHHEKLPTFTVRFVIDELRRVEGARASYVFGLGLYGAALSSSLTVALGSALCARCLLTEELASETAPERAPPWAPVVSEETPDAARKDEEDCTEDEAESGTESGGETARAVAAKERPVSPSSPAALEDGDAKMDGDLEGEARAGRARRESDEYESVRFRSGTPDDPAAPPAREACRGLATEWRDKEWRDKRGVKFRGVVLGTCGVAYVVGATGLPTIAVVLVAQVVNGALLPVVASCILLCSNDCTVVSRPAPSRRNCIGLACVAATGFLAANSLLNIALGAALRDATRFALAAALAALLVAALARTLQRQLAAFDRTPREPKAAAHRRKRRAGSVELRVLAASERALCVPPQPNPLV